MDLKPASGLLHQKPVYERFRPFTIQIGFIAIVIITWQLIADLHLFEETLFPSPRGILESFRLWFQNGGLITALEISLPRIAVGFLLAVAIGVPIGVLMGRIRLFELSVGTVFRILQPVPAIAWIPIAIIWFTSVSEAAKLFILLTGGLFPIVVTTASAVGTVPPVYVRCARTLGVKGFNMLRRVIIPASVPTIFAGMRIAWAFCWRALIAAEIILASRTGPGQEGLGGILDVSREFQAINLAGMVMVVLATLGYAIDVLLMGNLERRIRRKRGLE